MIILLFLGPLSTIFSELISDHLSSDEGEKIRNVLLGSGSNEISKIEFHITNVHFFRFSRHLFAFGFWEKVERFNSKIRLTSVLDQVKVMWLVRFPPTF